MLPFGSYTIISVHDSIHGDQPGMSVLYQLKVLSALNLALDIVSLAEEGVPIVEDLLVLVREIVPVWSALLWLQ